MKFDDFEVNLCVNDANIVEYGEVRAVKDGLTTVVLLDPFGSGKGTYALDAPCVSSL